MRDGTREGRGVGCYAIAGGNNALRGREEVKKKQQDAKLRILFVRRRICGLVLSIGRFVGRVLHI